MDLTSLFQAPLPVKIHVATVVPAALIGAVQLARPKGTTSHRALGYVFMVLMIVTAIAAFFVRSINGGFTPIHLFIPLTFFGVAGGLWRIRSGDVRGHRTSMISLYLGAIGIAGLLTLLPGRIMHTIFFGQ
jgi:uncharacterized membrane protein